MASRKSPLHDDDDQLLEQPGESQDAPAEDDEGDEEEGEESQEGDEGEEGEEGERESGDEGEEGETVISWADDEPGEGENQNSVLRKIRDRNKELARENAELRRNQQQQQQPAEELPPKPKPADFNYDDDAYDRARDEWEEKKQRITAQRDEQQRQTEALNREWQQDLNNYQAKREALAMDDYDEAIAPVRNRMNLAQQSVIVKAAQDPAAFSVALANSETRLNELAKIQDPFKLAAAIARMEGGVKVTKRRKSPQPDRPARGTARIASGGKVDKTEEKLIKDADETGDRTKLIAYRKQQRKAGQAA
jgi:hypothetical protein